MIAMLSKIAPTRFVPAKTGRLRPGALFFRLAALKRPTVTTGSVFVFALIGGDGQLGSCQGDTYDFTRVNGEWQATPAETGVSVIC
ncbi:hypothetical protein BH20ACT6_BH20ACT6_23620 [soil metagenome]